MTVTRAGGNSTLQASVNDASLGSAVEAYSQRHQVDFTLSTEQNQALRWVAEHYGQLGVEAYLNLASKGIALQVQDEARFRVLFDFAIQVDAGLNLSSDLASLDHDGRVNFLATEIRNMAAGGSVDGVALRNQHLGDAQYKVEDLFEQGQLHAPLNVSDVAQPELTRPRSTRTAVSKASAADAIAVEADYLMPAQRWAEVEVADGKTANSEFETPKAWAEALQKAQKGRVGTRKRKILDLVHNMHRSDLDLGAVAYSKLQGKNHTGKAARDFMLKEIAPKRGRDRIIFDSYVRENNPSGQMQSHDLVYLATSGYLGGRAFFGGDGDTAERILMNSTKAELLALDANMQRDYKKSLRETLVGGLRGRAERRALFILKAPRIQHEISVGNPPRIVTQSAGVPMGALRAYELHEAVRSIGADKETVFRVLEKMNQSEIKEGAYWYNELFVEKGERRDSDLSVDIQKTSLYQRLHSELGGKDGLWRKRLGLAVQGMQYDADDASRSETQQRDLVQEYLAVTIRLNGERQAGETELGELDTMNALGLMTDYIKHGNGELFRDARGEPVRQHLGMPTNLDVSNTFRRMYPGENIISDVQWGTDGREEKLATVALSGSGLNSPEGLALQLESAFNQGVFGLSEKVHDRVYDILDISARLAVLDSNAQAHYESALQRGENPAPIVVQNTEANRQALLTQVHAAFKRKTGRDLKAVIQDKIGDRVEVIGGIELPSRATVLAEQGYLSNAQHIIYAMYESQAFGRLAVVDWNEIRTTLAGMTPVDRLLTVMEYNRIMHPDTPLNLEEGRNPLVEDLRGMRGDDAELIALMAEILPSSIPQIVEQLSIFRGGTDATQVALLESNIGSRAEVLARNFGDADFKKVGIQRDGYAFAVALFQRVGRPAQIARSFALSDKELFGRIQNVAKEVRGNGPTRFLMDVIGPQGKQLENSLREINAVLRNAQHAPDGRALRPEEISPEALQAIDEAFAGVVSELITHDAFKDLPIEVVKNFATTLAIGFTVAIAPGTPFWALGLIGGVSQAGFEATFRGFKNPAKIVREGGRGLVKGALAGAGAHIVQGIAPTAGILERASMEGVAAGVQAAGVGLTNRMTELRTYTSFRHAVGTAGDNMLAEFGTGFGIGFVTSVVRQSIEQALKEDPPSESDPKDPKDTTDPKEPEDPTTRDPVDPGPEDPGPEDPGPRDPGPQEPDTPGDSDPGGGGNAPPGPPPGDSDPGGGGNAPGGGGATPPGDTDPGGGGNAPSGGSNPGGGGNPPGGGGNPPGGGTNPPGGGGTSPQGPGPGPIPGGNSPSPTGGGGSAPGGGVPSGGSAPSGGAPAPSDNSTSARSMKAAVPVDQGPQGFSARPTTPRPGVRTNPVVPPTPIPGGVGGQTTSVGSSTIGVSTSSGTASAMTTSNATRIFRAVDRFLTQSALGATENPRLDTYALRMGYAAYSAQTLELLVAQQNRVDPNMWNTVVQQAESAGIQVDRTLPVNSSAALKTLRDIRRQAASVASELEAPATDINATRTGRSSDASTEVESTAAAERPRRPRGAGGVPGLANFSHPVVDGLSRDYRQKWMIPALEFISGEQKGQYREIQNSDIRQLLTQFAEVYPEGTQLNTTVSALQKGLIESGFLSLSNEELALGQATAGTFEAFENFVANASPELQAEALRISREQSIDNALALRLVSLRFLQSAE